jgi:arylsulfatase A-like enzyme
VKRTILLFCLIAVVACDEETTEAPLGAPNIVFILTDDLDWRSMPYLDRLTNLASQGLVFNYYFVSASSCTPSRASTLRAQYPHNNGVLTNYPPLGAYYRFSELSLDVSTVATWLQEAGYRTMFLGKYINGYPGGEGETYIPPGWSEWWAPLGPLWYFDFKANHNGGVVDYPCCDYYGTDVMAATAVDFIRRAADNDEPFFMYLSTQAPHKPAEPPARYAGALSHVSAPRPPSFNEADRSDKPSKVRSRPLLTPEKIDEADELFRQRLRSMLAVEDMVDSVMSALESAGVDDETYVVFTSDNGFHYGEHGLGPGKVTAYDEDIRVPLFVIGPGIAAGQVEDRIVISHDLAPTFADLAGATSPLFVDGRSFRHLLSGSNAITRWRRAALVERFRRDPERPPPLDLVHVGYKAIRTAGYLYVEWDTDEFELYNRYVDPWEMENIYERADPNFLAQLSAWLDRLSNCAGSSCQAAENESPPRLRLQH